MYSIFIALIIAGVAVLPANDSARPTPERAAFVTTLGRDTVVVESFTRTATHVDGTIVVRVPGTVLLHYTVDMGAGGAITHTLLDTKPLGTADVYARRVTLDFIADSVRITFDSSGHKQTLTRALSTGEFPLLMTGFGASYGLYSSLGMYDLLLPHVLSAPSDTTSLQSIDMATGRVTRRQFVRRSPSLVDVDYFGAVWTHLTVDGSGSIVSADASGTTEMTQSHRTDIIDIERMAAEFAANDHAGRGIGAASVNKLDRGTIGGQPIIIAYGSPKKRDRVILGNVVPYGRVWRTGANEATTITFGREVSVAGAAVPAGTYSLWTLPKSDGTAQLIINRQHGQWGTDYDPSQDLVRVPMQVATSATPREDFAIVATGTGNTGELRMSWDTFVWSVPVVPK